jgi:hypothetical protein
MRPKEPAVSSKKHIKSQCVESFCIILGQDNQLAWIVTSGAVYIRSYVEADIGNRQEIDDPSQAKELISSKCFLDKGALHSYCQASWNNKKSKTSQKINSYNDGEDSFRHGIEITSQSRAAH